MKGRSRQELEAHDVGHHHRRWRRRIGHGLYLARAELNRSSWSVGRVVDVGAGGRGDRCGLARATSRTQSGRFGPRSSVTCAWRLAGSNSSRPTHGWCRFRPDGRVLAFFA